MSVVSVRRRLLLGGGAGVFCGLRFGFACYCAQFSGFHGVCAGVAFVEIWVVYCGFTGFLFGVGWCDMSCWVFGMSLLGFGILLYWLALVADCFCEWLWFDLVLVFPWVFDVFWWCCEFLGSSCGRL